MIIGYKFNVFDIFIFGIYVTLVSPCLLIIHTLRGGQFPIWVAILSGIINLLSLYMIIKHGSMTTAAVKYRTGEERRTYNILRLLYLLHVSFVFNYVLTGPIREYLPSFLIWFNGLWFGLFVFLVYHFFLKYAFDKNG